MTIFAISLIIIATCPGPEGDVCAEVNGIAPSHAAGHA